MRSSFVKDYLTFSKKEGIAILSVVAIILVLVFLPYLKKSPSPSFYSSTDSSWLKAADNLKDVSSSIEKSKYDENATSFQADRTIDTYTPEQRGELFTFDPNTLSAEGLKKLGLRDKTVQILINYRNKGGKFRTADDMQKIYGLKPEEYIRVKPFIVIAGNNIEYAQTTYKKDPKLNGNTPSFKAKPIDINTADTTEFKSLYGIGSKFAAKIVNFRSKLGGFYSIDQVKETYGLPDSTFEKIKPLLQLNNKNLQKLNLNTATYDELNAHPYISGKLAYLIVKQRKEKGNYSNVESIKELVAQTTDVYEKLVNYLKVD